MTETADFRLFARPSRFIEIPGTPEKHNRLEFIRRSYYTGTLPVVNQAPE
jgi:hypothetical protein